MNDCILTQEEMALQSVVQPAVFADNGKSDDISIYNSILSQINVESFDVVLSVLNLIRMNKELLKQLT